MERSVANMLIAGLMLLAVVLACSTGFETDKANQLVARGNSAIEEGKKHFKDAEEKKDKMLHTDVSHLAEARTIASEAMRDYDQAQLSDVYKQYLDLKVKEFNKRAELIEAARSIPQALIDSQSRPSFVTRANAATDKANKLNQEASDLSDQADKLEKDNPDIFKK